MRLADHAADPTILVRGGVRIVAIASDPEEVARPPGEQVVDEHEEEEQGQQHGQEASADPHQTPVETAELLLLRDRALLQLDQTLRHAPILGSVLALSIADVAQELPELVVVVHA
jgi:DNA-directed RNA polymerase specialized sigma24 family protein